VSVWSYFFLAAFFLAAFFLGAAFLAAFFFFLAGTGTHLQSVVSACENNGRKRP
jgi:hypothetical protein